MEQASSHPRASHGLSLGTLSHPHAEDVPGPSGEAAEGVEEIPQELELPWDDMETMMHMFLKHGDRVDMVYEDYADPQIRKLEIRPGVVNKEIRVSHTCAGIRSILALCVICSMV